MRSIKVVYEFSIVNPMVHLEKLLKHCWILFWKLDRFTHMLKI